MARVPKSPNTLYAWHWSTRARDKKAWRHGLQAVLGIPAHRYQGRVHLRIMLFTKRLMDPDNLTGAMKPVIDGLRDLGWLFDDDAAHLSLVVMQYRERFGADYGVLIHWRGDHATANDELPD